MSDWGGTHSTILAANAGLDQEMAEPTFFNETLKEAVINGNVSMSTLDEKGFFLLLLFFLFFFFLVCIY